MRARTAVIGTGYSPVARRSPMPLGELAQIAVRRAAEDAGITVERIDGLCADLSSAPVGVDGADLVSPGHLAASLDLPDVRWSASLVGASFAGAVVEAAHAIASGSCRYVAVWKAMRGPRRGRSGHPPEARGVEWELLAPYGLGDNITMYAMPYSRYLARYGVRRERMADFVVSNRRNAAMNPDAIFFGQPIAAADYLESRMIVEPLSLLDCDMPVDGCGAVIVAAADRASDAPHGAAYVVGHASFAQRRRTTLVLTPEAMTADAARLGRALWSSAGLGPGDIGQAHLYDGFSFLVYLWLEGLGFCGAGEAADFMREGRAGGALPLNTSGGSLGMGRLHGPPQVIEAVRQIQGRCGPRQIPDAGTALAVTGQPSAVPGAVLFSRSPRV